MAVVPGWEQAHGMSWAGPASTPISLCLAISTYLAALTLDLEPEQSMVLGLWEAIPLALHQESSYCVS